MKVSILTNILAPYRFPLFEEIRSRVERLDVVLMARRDRQRQWQIYDYEFSTHFLPGLHCRPPGCPFSVRVNYGTRNLLRKVDPDVLVCGDFAPANISGYLYSLKFGKKHLGWGELDSQDFTQVSWIRRRILRAIITGSIASSSRARKLFCTAAFPRTEC
ncbi:MAG: hypothetical protein AB7U63_09965 [Porticoccaceae bacterium]